LAEQRSRFQSAVKGLSVVALVGLFSFTGIELTGRALGLHRPVLYETTAYGYRPQPNQDLRRFGNRVFYNAQGMRSESFEPKPLPGVLRILCIGDSITNGGTQTDQSKTYPYILQDLLAAEGRKAEVLNASAGGWSLANEAGWLKANGLHGADVVVLEVATHDLFQPFVESEIVGADPHFPDQRPHWATGEMLQRYILPRLGFSAQAKDPGVQLDGQSLRAVQDALGNIDRIASIAKAGGAKLYVLHVEQPEDFEPRDALTQQAKQRLRDYLRRREIALIESSARMSVADGSRLFRDSMHPNAQGNRKLAEAVAEVLQHTH
jgi:lysophospholipase L1-like esterase